MARRWQKMAGNGRRRVPLPKAGNELADKGHFVVYSTDKRRFVVPLPCLRNNIFRELFRMSEEEFGLPRDGPITLPLDAASLEAWRITVENCGVEGVVRDSNRSFFGWFFASTILS
ncbi:hypothetical protein F0562_026876 [Nyssa sinensis]|uniref:Uncharacterized protein n=1 Tax=Nyssa sinensis TaxID=561372 RepID=A0A5J5B6Q1_9ASTE|nr:hypothetical protein F0562_026876 [Nyssa sinensis]